MSVRRLLLRRNDKNVYRKKIKTGSAFKKTYTLSGLQDFNIPLGAV